MSKNKMQQGAVSMFIVVFSALLITIISVGFTGIMVQNQQQATVVDLSQSAYDSAQAGIEDAKRALLRYQNICSDSSKETECQAVIAEINSQECNQALMSLDGVSDSLVDGEIKIKTNGVDNKLDQAYTCVKIKLETDDYLGTLVSNDLKLIPLVGVSGFNKVKLSWFSQSDVSTGNANISLISPTSNPPLIAQSNWPPNRPSVMQVKLMQYGDSFNIDSLESSENNNTLFLYPSLTGANEMSFSLDSHKTQTGTPQPVRCRNNLSAGGYACNVDLLLPDHSGAGDRNAYLVVRSLYNKSSFSISLMDNSNNIVRFNGVQTEVDSTGRANDLFRRVKARVELTDMNFPYPEASVDINSDFCKDFSITDSSADFSSTCN